MPFLGGIMEPMSGVSFISGIYSVALVRLLSAIFSRAVVRSSVP